jgi:integrase
VELILCTGMRKGEALALHWADVDLDAQVLLVRYTLSNINNTTPMFSTPKTKSSHTWIGLSQRAPSAPCTDKRIGNVSSGWLPARHTEIRIWSSRAATDNPCDPTVIIGRTGYSTHRRRRMHLTRLGCVGGRELRVGLIGSAGPGPGTWLRAWANPTSYLPPAKRASASDTRCSRSGSSCT